MKKINLICILTALIFQSCIDHSTNSSKINQQDSVFNTAIVQNDSLKNKDWRLTEIEKALPEWPDSSLAIGTVKKMNANVSSTLCTHIDGVSMTTYLFTFNNKKVKDHETLQYGADQDLSSSTDYEYKELKDSMNNTFTVVNYTQSVNDKSVLTKNGAFKKGFDFENVKIKTDSTVISLSILNDGQIRRDTLKY